MDYELPNHLYELKPNWDTYGAQPPNGMAFRLAKTVLSLLKFNKLVPNSIYASPDDGICMSFYSIGFYADIECFNDGDILGTIVFEDGKPMMWEMRYNNIARQIKTFCKLVKDD